MIENLAVIGPAAVGLLLIGFSQSAGDARAFASKHKYRIDINQESVAQGMANVGSGLVQGIPVSTSLSASSLNDTSGAKTPVASLTTGALIILTLLLLAPLFSNLPKAVLSALIIEAVVMGMMDVKEMRRLRRVARVDFWIAIAAILGVLSAGVLAGVMIGVLLSLGWLIYISATPHMLVLGRKPGTEVFRGVADHSDYETYPGLLVLRFDAGLFFASADALEDRLRELVQQADPKPQTIVLDFEGVNFIDSQGTDKVAEILGLATSYGIELRLARVKTEVKVLLQRDGVIDRLGESRIYGNVYEAVADKIPTQNEWKVGRIINPIIARAKGSISLVLVTMLTSMGLNVVMADPYGSALLGTRMFKDVYQRQRLKPVVLAVAISDSGTAISHIIPWNLIGVLLAGTLGLAVAAWAPYAFMGYLTPIVTFVIAYIYKGRLTGGGDDDAGKVSGEEPAQPDESIANLA